MSVLKSLQVQDGVARFTPNRREALRWVGCALRAELTELFTVQVVV